MVTHREALYRMTHLLTCKEATTKMHAAKSLHACSASEATRIVCTQEATIKVLHLLTCKEATTKVHVAKPLHACSEATI